MTLLEQIVFRKRREVEESGGRRPLAALEKALADAPPVRPFPPAFLPKAGGGSPGIIAEMKRKSPSRGEIRNPYAPLEIAESYRRSGAAALSILTDGTFFGGALDDLATVRKSPAGEALPILRKDFIVDPYQVLESRVAGADILLLIVRILPGDLLKLLLSLGSSLGMSVLVETHSDREVEAALSAGARMVGVNSRDLDTLEIDLARGARLLAGLPEGVVRVAESGLKTHADYRRMADLGVDALLVGESFLSASDPGRALEEFRGIVD
jgi:indole-3-glycerol phosphate synthase